MAHGGSGSASTPAARSPTSSPSTRTRGELLAVKTPSTPADPAEGFLTGIRKVLAALGAGPDDLASVSHGTTVATNQLLTGDVTGIGFVTTDGFEHLLEIARQSVPDGYGNSYFWVKPPRIVPADLVRTVGGRLDHTRHRTAPLRCRQAPGQRPGRCASEA